MFAPPKEVIEAVQAWLVGAGFAAETISLSANRQWIQFDAHAEKVEDLLVADFFEYEHLASGSKTVAVDEYHVPLGLREHIDYITPGVRLRPDPSRRRKVKRGRKKDGHYLNLPPR
ncbi:tripeptidyl-peptidase sed1 [Colletotrichum liriopes]|uniref:Tripeptidyl-peptidase sed1 n=1 Tax=Colletotrichum liriopes TaxID=708192 RepID=A0AA37GY59_9PEZI|nr:tripeptidyl-peptidase sed1 [Colletotrichum liriopes]